jgi:hypothetical protein
VFRNSHEAVMSTQELSWEFQRAPISPGLCFKNTHEAVSRNGLPSWEFFKCSHEASDKLRLRKRMVMQIAKSSFTRIRRYTTDPLSWILVPQTGGMCEKIFIRSGRQNVFDIFTSFREYLGECVQNVG